MKPRKTPPTRGLVAVVWHDLFSFLLSWISLRDRPARCILLSPEEWVILRSPFGGVIVSFTCNAWGGHRWVLVDKGSLPQNFVRLRGGKYEFILGVQNHPVGDGVEQSTGKDVGASDSGNHLIGSPSHGHNDTGIVGIVGNDLSFDGKVKGIDHGLIILENSSYSPYGISGFELREDGMSKERKPQESMSSKELTRQNRVSTELKFGLKKLDFKIT